MSSTRLPSIRTEWSTRERMMATPSPTLVKGPTCESTTRAPRPMMTGPRTTERSTTAPSSTVTRPSRRLSSSTRPRTSCLSHESSTVALASSRSSFLPVSSHHEATRSKCTSPPSSMSLLMASVISSSPRAEGRMRSMASKMAGRNRYTPTRARLLFGSAGFSTKRTTRPCSSTSATPNAEGLGTSLSMTEATSEGRARKVSTAPRTLVPMRLSPRYMQKGSSWPR